MTRVENCFTIIQGLGKAVALFVLSLLLEKWLQSSPEKDATCKGSEGILGNFVVTSMTTSLEKYLS